MADAKTEAPVPKMKIERTARVAVGCSPGGGAGKLVVMFGSAPGGWFERYFASEEKARAHAARKGWTVK